MYVNPIVQFRLIAGTQLLLSLLVPFVNTKPWNLKLQPNSSTVALYLIILICYDSGSEIQT